MDPADVVWTRKQSAIPSSVCSQPCGVGEVKITQQVRNLRSAGVISSVGAAAESAVKQDVKLSLSSTEKTPLFIIASPYTIDAFYFSFISI